MSTKKTKFHPVCAALFVSLFFVFNATQAQTTKTIYSDTALEGDFYGTIVFGASNITLDLNGYSIYRNGTGYGVSATGKSNVVIMNGTIRNCQYGVYLSGTTSTECVNLELYSCSRGIYARSNCRYLYVDGCTSYYNTYGYYYDNCLNFYHYANYAFQNSQDGIYAYKCRDAIGGDWCRLMGNSQENGRDGLFMYNTKNVIIQEIPYEGAYFVSNTRNGVTFDYYTQNNVLSGPCAMDYNENDGFKFTSYCKYNIIQGYEDLYVTMNHNDHIGLNIIYSSSSNNYFENCQGFDNGYRNRYDADRNTFINCIFP